MYDIILSRQTNHIGTETTVRLRHGGQFVVITDRHDMIDITPVSRAQVIAMGLSLEVEEAEAHMNGHQARCRHCV